MNISEKAKQHIDSCRFCWMCRHICPISIATGQERNTARARALSLSLVVRGAENTSEVVDNLYECALCGACVKECVTGWDPVMFTREAKTSACLEGVIPEYIGKLLDNLDATGNVYGKTTSYVAPQKGDALLLLGEDARIMSKDSCDGAVKLLTKAGVSFSVLSDEPNTGSSMYYLTGKSQETVELMKKCADVLNGYKTVIVYDPADLKLILREYKEFGIEVKAEIVGFNAYLLKLINDGKLTVNKTDKQYTVQDNFNYSRELDDSVTVRAIVKKVGEAKDFLMSGKDTMFAGSLLMHEYMSEQIEKVALTRWKNANGIGATSVVTESPSEYEMLKMTKPDGFELLTVEQMILENLK